MADPMPKETTLDTLHQDLREGFADLKGEVQSGFADLKQEVRSGFADLKQEVQGGFADLKVTLVAGFRSMPAREDSQEMIRLLRERNRILRDHTKRWGDGAPSP